MQPLNLKQFAPLASNFDPMEQERILVEAANNVPGTLTDYDCPKCKNRGVFFRLSEDGRRYTVRCDCMPIRESIRHMEKSGLKNSIRKMSFDTFDAKEPWQITAKQGVEAYARDGIGWLLLSGQSGCGKTHLCTAVCRQRLLERVPVQYMPWREEVAKLKAMSLDGENREALLSKYKKAPLLYIDDLFKTCGDLQGVGRPSAADVGLAFELINYRYINNLPTLVSTELLPDELLQVDQAVASRILEMAGSHVYAFNREEGKNYRLRNVVHL